MRRNGIKPIIARNHGRTDSMLIRVYWRRELKGHARWLAAHP